MTSRTCAVNRPAGELLSARRTAWISGCDFRNGRRVEVIARFRRRMQAFDMPAAKTIFVSFSGEIDSCSAQALTTAMTRCADHDAEEVCLMFATPGGNVSEGIYLYNMLRACPFRLTVHNVGMSIPSGPPSSLHPTSATPARRRGSCFTGCPEGSGGQGRRSA